ncbi:hypothetical protein C9994_09810 [Marivirga lumbricoides]|uniref:Uncharacterized protein n=1 Tax=Marivirga lumbricoides TaxID=1046115 RepID=A0A2T4DPW9_9BACT|nr:hypothetical protein C9994_09810 [Marivirga lumbricoides]
MNRKTKVCGSQTFPFLLEYKPQTSGKKRSQSTGTMMYLSLPQKPAIIVIPEIFGEQQKKLSGIFSMK